MSFTNRLVQSEVEELSDIVIEGGVASASLETLPLASGALPCINVRMMEDFSIVRSRSSKSSALEEYLTRILNKRGFWCYPELFRVSAKQRIRASLARHKNSPLLLPPASSEFSIVDATTGESCSTERTQIDNCPNFGPMLQVPPIHYLNWIRDRKDEFRAAANEWHDHLGAAEYVEEAAECFPVTCWHYDIRWLELGPVSEEDPESPPLAITNLYMSDGQRPGINTGNCHINMNSSVPWNVVNNTPTASEWDFQSSLLHELGHALGLDHRDDEPESVMRKFLRRQTIKRHLTEQDSACIKNLYGEGIHK